MGQVHNYNLKKTKVHKYIYTVHLYIGFHSKYNKRNIIKWETKLWMKQKAAYNFFSTV